MLRINLLPAYVGQKRLNKKMTAAFTAAFIIVVGGLLGWEFLILRPADANETTMANDAVAAKAYLDSETALAASTLAAAAPVQANIQFYHDVQTYNASYPDLYEEVARFTSPKILYTSMAVDGQTLTIDAYTPSIEELGRYLQVMYHEPDITSVSVASIPTPDQAAEKIYMYKGRVIGVSGGTVTSGTQTTTIPGVPAGVAVTLPAGVKLPGGPVSNQTVPGALPPLVPGGPNNVQAAPGTPADVYSLIESDPDFNPKLFKIVVRRTDGFTFVATCALKKSFAPPAVPSGAAAAPAAGGPAAGGPPAADAGGTTPNS